MKKGICALLLALLLSGCAGPGPLLHSRELEDLELIRTAGLDRDETGLVTLSAAAGTGMDEAGPRLYTVRAATLAAAVDRMERQPLGKEALFSHLEHLVLSEAAARELMPQVLDFIARSPDLRLETNLFVVRNMTAEALLTGASEKGDISELLTTLARNAPYLGLNAVLPAREVLNALSLEGAALLAAVSGVRSEAEDCLTVIPAGFALLTKGALSGYLPPEASRGAALLMGRVRGGTEYVRLAEGLATLDLTETACRARLLWEDGAPAALLVSARVSAELTSLDGPALTERDRRLMEAALRDRWEARLTEALDAARREGDYIGLGRRLALRHPFRTSALGAAWPEALAEVPVTVSVEAAVRRSGDLDAPVSLRGEEAEKHGP